MNNLLGQRAAPDLQNLSEPCIVISDDLSPSEAALMNRKLVLGFATDVGSKTSHTAIMARSLQVPAIVGLKGRQRQDQERRRTLLLDGYNGSLIVNPTDQTLFEYGQLIRRHASIEEKLQAIQIPGRHHPGGKTITLSANIEQTGDIAGGQGIRGRGRGPLSHGIPVHQSRHPCQPRRSNTRPTARSRPS